MSGMYKKIFSEIVQAKRRNGYRFMEEYCTQVNGKSFKYLAFHLDLELFQCALQLAEEKARFTMAQNQANVPRDAVTKVRKCAQGVLAEMFVHLLLTERYGFSVKRYDLERPDFTYSSMEYDLKITVNGKEFKVESRSSAIHHRSVKKFVAEDVIIGPYGNDSKPCDALADFHFRPIYLPEFVSFEVREGKIYCGQEWSAGEMQLVITGVATKHDFMKHSYISTLGQRGTQYNVLDAFRAGDIDEMDRKFEAIGKM